MKIIDTTDSMLSSFAADGFRMESWEAYMDAAIPGAKELCLDDMRACLKAGCSWENDYLPVLNAVANDADKREAAVRSFHALADRLEEAVLERFGRTVDADLVLYLGLCCGAGWVTQVRGRTTVLFGIEKIMELNWQEEDAMKGLILHELGHVYQSQYGVLKRETPTLRNGFLWQLFTEGIAMVFEQEILKDPEAYHQYDREWKQWCERHAERIKRSFSDDLDTMTHANQRYFGDWVSFEGHGDTGYYLGARFIRFLLRSESFDRLLRYDSDEVAEAFERFLSVDLGKGESGAAE